MSEDQASIATGLPQMSSTDEVPSGAPVVEINFPADGKKSFFSQEEIREWLAQERSAWEWTRDVASQDGNYADVMNQQFVHDDPIMRSLASVGDASNPADPYYRQVAEYLNDRYVGRRAIPSFSPRAKFIFSLAERDRIIAASAAWVLMGNDPRPGNKQHQGWQGIILATLYMAGLYSKQKPFDAAIKQLFERVTGEHETLRSEAAGLKLAFETLTGEIRAVQAAQAEEFKSLQSRREEEHAALVKGHTEKLEDIRRTFAREMELRSAVDYLKTKADSHKAAARTSGRAAVAVGAVLLLVSVIVAVLVFSSTGAATPPRLAVAALGVTLMFWLLRVLVRTYLSNMHLETDLRMRSTFVHTYLALLSEGGGIKDEDRKLVINLVFRPISDGLVKDDAAPFGIWDLLTRGK